MGAADVHICLLKLINCLDQIVLCALDYRIVTLLIPVAVKCVYIPVST